ncbi:hypothetical protein P6166_17010 [Stenotrophomonas sp. HITSZ_GD]|uniref:LolA family protein n=1 Tax=Stenotrophomonas sp. HITSZ_GD TaxID=3037248 RepID=UPI00240D9CF8|nr:hypothetical protein [Stenotrophomonas sp. HITSZ_GD]MDG2527055.1 hypothetical protein [Stenotrophomonas sp. HITSZ_GD]
MTPRSRPALAALLAFAMLPGCTRSPDAAPSAAAAPRAETGGPHAPAQQVLDAMSRFRAARAFEARMRLEGARPQESRLAYVAPDRYRLQLPMGTQVVIGDTLYLQAGDRSERLPLPRGLLAQWRDPLQLQAGEQLQVEDLGADPIDGQPAHLYRVIHPDPARPPMRLWVDADGRPRRVEQRGRDDGGADYRLQIDYGRFDDPALRIDAP